MRRVSSSRREATTVEAIQVVVGVMFVRGGFQIRQPKQEPTVADRQASPPEHPLPRWVRQDLRFNATLFLWVKKSHTQEEA